MLEVLNSITSLDPQNKNLQTILDVTGEPNGQMTLVQKMNQIREKT